MCFFSEHTVSLCYRLIAIKFYVIIIHFYFWVVLTLKTPQVMALCGMVERKSAEQSAWARQTQHALNDSLKYQIGTCAVALTHSELNLIAWSIVRNLEHV